MNNLNNHIDAALMGSETTGVNVNPWRIGDGYTTPNIHQPWTPSPSDIKAREWERIMREIVNAPTPTTTSTGTKVIVDPPTSRNRTIKFKEIVFTAYLSDEAMEFFEDDRHVTRDELRLLEVAHPKEYAKIKRAWIAAWKELQALNAFEND
ncbi:hypothetical protein P7_212 [Pectobacterium phage vB_PcaM_P7_Pc]|nr:hypothetical protein P7_212 [Pectobacterium phage vB_PcaM_P7_Pc]